MSAAALSRRVNAHRLAPAQRAVVDALLASGEPVPRAKLAAEYGRVPIELERTGHLFEATGGGLFPTPLTIRELDAYPPWSPAEEDRLRALWPTHLPIGAVAAEIGRPGGDVIQHAWALGLDRRPAAAGPETAPAAKNSSDAFGPSIPAWRIKRLRAVLREAQHRGTVTTDDGADLAHRALRLRFAAGRAAGTVRANRNWTRYQKGQLTLLFMGGHSRAAAARRMGRPLADIERKVTDLGLDHVLPWTLEEDERLVAAFDAREPMGAIKTMFPRRSSLDIALRAEALFLTGETPGRPVTAEEMENLRAALDGPGLVAWCRENGRTVPVARLAAAHLDRRHGVRAEPLFYVTRYVRVNGWTSLDLIRTGKPQRAEWNAAEDRIVTTCVREGWGNADILRRLPGRNFPQLVRRIRELGLVGLRRPRRAAKRPQGLPPKPPRKAWTEETIASLVAWVRGGKPLAAWCLANGRSAHNAERHCRRAGLFDGIRPGPGRPYSPDEDRAIREGVALEKTPAEIALHLPGRSIASISVRGCKLRKDLPSPSREDVR